MMKHKDLSRSGLCLVVVGCMLTLAGVGVLCATSVASAHCAPSDGLCDLVLPNGSLCLKETLTCTNGLVQATAYQAWGAPWCHTHTDLRLYVWKGSYYSHVKCTLNSADQSYTSGHHAGIKYSLLYYNSNKASYRTSNYYYRVSSHKQLLGIVPGASEVFGHRYDNHTRYKYATNS